ncbi:hypothetical protein [Mycobacterium sp. IEC1808]|uniref:hypothetical protein n=1 Tax=Mycobacterium sp. IEC1808 TaxID=1743230 RepID=UPI001154A98B|nr:hypothetical protein [Mycobacterium sp. IEC1808]
MQRIDVALSTATAWTSYAENAVGVVLLIVLPLGAVIYGVVTARGRQRKRLVVIVLTTFLVYVGVVLAANLWANVHKHHKTHHPTGVPASHSS